MGTWGTGFLDDDLAMDVKVEFEEALNEGLNVKEATKMILNSFEEELEDEDEACVIYLAISILQIEQGVIQKSIKRKVKDIIMSGQALIRWEDAEKDIIEDRKKVIQELSEKLNDSNLRVFD